MTLPFVNRDREWRELDAAARHGGLLVVYGRRRVGKSRLLREWLGTRGGLYSQAIEAPSTLQVQQAYLDLRAQLETTIVPSGWSDLFELLGLQKSRWTLCLDEFPYLTASDPSLPSRLQRLIDQGLPHRSLLILAGSSVRMMHGLFLNRTAPLYGRARKLLRIDPMDYTAFCGALELDPGAMETFELFSTVGGIPKYWELLEPGHDAVAAADALYFDFAPYMEQEPLRALRDEKVGGAGALAVLEAIGRGAERPSEIATRLSTSQTNLSRLLQQLLDGSVLDRAVPFGESVRSTRRTLYRIQDPALRFWFRVYSPHRTLWRTLDRAERRRLIHEHAASVFEDFCRSRVPGAQRYWEAGVELDLVAPDPEHRGGLLAAEAKWRRLSTSARTDTRRRLEAAWARSALSARHPRVRFEVFDASTLPGADPR